MTALRVALGKEPFIMTMVMTCFGHTEDSVTSEEAEKVEGWDGGKPGVRGRRGSLGNKGSRQEGWGWGCRQRAWGGVGLANEVSAEREAWLARILAGPQISVQEGVPWG